MTTIEPPPAQRSAARPATAMLPLTAEEHKLLCAVEARYNEYVDTIRGKNGWARIDKPHREEFAAKIRAEFGRDPLTNEERSKIEVYEFLTDPPAKYFLYVNEDTRRVTTWTGDILADRISLGHLYRSAFGDKHRSVRFKAINGLTYSGTYYCHNGNYARVRAVKA